jgi:hypothetical protein
MGFWLSFDGLACSENSASRLQPFWMSSVPQALLCIANEHLYTFVACLLEKIGKQQNSACERKMPCFAACFETSGLRNSGYVTHPEKLHVFS